MSATETAPTDIAPTDIAAAVTEGVLPGRVWMYANYHCNIACRYCLTESGPKVARRALSPDTMLEIGRQARELGFTDLGVTGGERSCNRTCPMCWRTWPICCPRWR